MNKSRQGFANELIKKQDNLTFSEVREHLTHLDVRTNKSIKSTPKRNSLYSNLVSHPFTEISQAKRNSLGGTNNFLNQFLAKTQTQLSCEKHKDSLTPPKS